jgi:cystathionine beta-lyase/cystathionine gamma-synthase
MQRITVPTINGTGGDSGHVEAEAISLALRDARPATSALHADEALRLVDDIAPPIHVSTTYKYPNDPERLRPFYGREIGVCRPLLLSLTYKLTSPQPTELVYSRESSANPTRLEAVLSSLLKAPCLTYSSGLAAVHAAYTLLNPKQVSIGDGYHGTHGVLEIHKRVSGCKELPLDCKAEELSAGDLICLETPVNPTGNAFNIAHYAEKAHSRGAYLMVDSTFAPPPLQDPFKWGADIVMHSGTKYIGGHSDMLCGILATENKNWLAKLAEDRVFLGSVMGSLEGWLGVRSVRTLELRVQRQSQNAMDLVEALNGALSGHTVGTGLSHSDVDVIKAVVAEIRHASLQHTDKPWLAKQMPAGYGPVFAVVMKTEDLAKHLPSKLNFFAHATSLGGVESLVEWRTMSDATVDRTLLRFSIGIEDHRDLLEDLVAGFRALHEGKQQ